MRWPLAARPRIDDRTTLLPGIRVSTRGLRWEVLFSQSAGEETLHRLRCREGTLRGSERDFLSPFERLEPVTTDLRPERTAPPAGWRLFHQAFLLDEGEDTERSFGIGQSDRFESSFVNSMVLRFVAPRHARAETTLDDSKYEAVSPKGPESPGPEPRLGPLVASDPFAGLGLGFSEDTRVLFVVSGAKAVASRRGMSVRTLIRRFREGGRTIALARQACRADIVSQLLMTDLPTASVARAIGFSGPQALGRFVRGCFGLTTSGLRAELRRRSGSVRR